MISFVIPAFNEQELIGPCLTSIALDNAGIPHEVIVVDNGSTDNTAMVARRHGAVVISEPRKGVTRARQTGFLKSTGSYVAFIDADNELPLGWTDLAMNAMGLNVVAASGPPIYHEIPLHKRLTVFVFYTIAWMISRVFPVLQGGCFIVSRAALEQIGGFDTNIEFYGEDTDTAVRLSKVGRVVFDPKLCMWSSARRLMGEGLIRSGIRYVVNFVWVHIFGRPHTDEYRDIRPT